LVLAAAPRRVLSAHSGTVEDRTETLLKVLRGSTKTPWLPDEHIEVKAVLARVEAAEAAAAD
jgi:hypothetical protein